MSKYIIAILIFMLPLNAYSQTETQNLENMIVDRLIELTEKEKITWLERPGDDSDSDSYFRVSIPFKILENTDKGYRYDLVTFRLIKYSDYKQGLVVSYPTELYKLLVNSDSGMSFEITSYKLEDLYKSIEDNDFKYAQNLKLKNLKLLLNGLNGIKGK